MAVALVAFLISDTYNLYSLWRLAYSDQPIQEFYTPLVGVSQGAIAEST
jgi:hypothetical protein